MAFSISLGVEFLDLVLLNFVKLATIVRKALLLRRLK